MEINSNSINDLNKVLKAQTLQEIELRKKLLEMILKSITYDNEAGLAVIVKHHLEILIEDWKERTKNSQEKLKEYE